MNFDKTCHQKKKGNHKAKNKDLVEIKKNHVKIFNPMYQVKLEFHRLLNLAPKTWSMNWWYPIYTSDFRK